MSDTDSVQGGAEGLHRAMRIQIDFDVDADEKTVFDEEIPEQRRLWNAILNHPATLRRVAALVLVNEVKGRLDRLVEDLLPNADYDDLIAGVQEHLNEEDRRYWEAVKRGADTFDELTFRLFPVFEAFRISLQRVLLQDQATGTTIPMEGNGTRNGGGTVIPIRRSSADDIPRR